MFGGNGGKDWDDGRHKCVRKISVVHGTCINSIKVEYRDEGVTDDVVTVRHGGAHNPKATTEATFELKPKEFITKVSGYYGKVKDHSEVIRSLTFETHFFGLSGYFHKGRTSELYGTKEGTSFSFPDCIDKIKILGFTGRSDTTHLNAIGFHYEVPKVNTSEVFGGNDGLAYWDDQSHKCVRKIKVVHGTCINSIEVAYGDKGVTEDVVKERHGGGLIPTKKEATFTLKPKEFITKVSGHYGHGVIGSLTFETHFFGLSGYFHKGRTSELYGTEGGTPFSFPGGIAKIKILGFTGSSDTTQLNAIGFHYKVPKIEKFKEAVLH